MMDSFEAQKVISRFRPANALVIGTMTTGTEWAHISTIPDLDLPMGGAMGKASSLGLGLALARPDLKVLVLDGDGSLLMNLGSLITIANMAPRNLIHFVFANGVYRTTGGQPLPGQGKFCFAGLAQAAGYANTYELDEIAQLEESLPEIMSADGPSLVRLSLPPATQRPPYPFQRTAAVLDRFRAGLDRTLVKV